MCKVINTSVGISTFVYMLKDVNVILKNVINILSLFLIIGFISKPHSTKEIIIWSEAKKLRWKDFQGKPDSFSRASARTFIDIKMEYMLGDFIISSTVVCRFFKGRSWSLDTTFYALKHEQTHFDLGEVYARKLRKVLSESRLFFNKSSKNKIDSLYQCYLTLHKQAQDEYDSETIHGQRKSIQEEWDERVKKELADLKKYR